jgi:hypothetical protein
MIGHLYSNLDELFIQRGWRISQSKNVIEKPNEQHYIHSKYPNDEFRIEIEKKNIINVVVPVPKSLYLFKKTFISYSHYDNDHDEQTKDENLYNSIFEYIVAHMNNYEEKMN